MAEPTDAPSPDEAARAAIRHWSSLAELATFAVDRHGFGNTDGGFGVTYPNDLDEYDRVVDGVEIPAGHVLIYGYWGPPEGYELLMSEADYLSVLAQVLESAGYAEEAANVRLLIDQADRR